MVILINTSLKRVPSPKSRPSLSGLGSCAALTVLCLAFGSAPPARAQSDNFDSYSTAANMQAAGWILSSINPALVTTSFPDVGSGKSLRIRANPVPGTAPAVGMWYRTNEYSDFCVSLDIMTWPGTDKNQAVVLFARFTESSTGTVVPNQNPATAQGLICNYDTSQYGENPGDRRQGQLQINIVRAGFVTTTIAVAEITFEPGRPYRIVFRGVGTHLEAEAYDWHDLTQPLVRLETEDVSSGFFSGACGILSFSRQSTAGTTDVTVDNYYAGVTDPNLATAPARSHPLAGTPMVDTRSPSNRWQNFWNPASGITFTAKTYSADVINAAATRLLLNGQDVSSQLTVSANGTAITGSLPGSALQSNRLYSAAIVVTDTTGTKSSTNTFWFDTFSDAYLLSSGVKVVEAEEYNYNGGVFQLDPIPVSGIDTNLMVVNGLGVGYYDATGISGIDYTNRNLSPDFNFSAFRPNDRVRTLKGGLLGIDDWYNLDEYAPGSDNIRSVHAVSNLLEYVVTRTEPTEWLNYTRRFDSGFYASYLRFSSFGATTNELHRVTSDPTQENQTTSKLGNFRIPNNIRFINYSYSPLVDDSGAPVLLNLAGTNTLRLVIAGALGPDNRKTMLNYMMFVQAPITLYSSTSAAGPYLAEPGATVNVSARTVTIPVSGGERYYRIGSNVAVPIKRIAISGGNVVLTL